MDDVPYLVRSCSLEEYHYGVDDILLISINTVSKDSSLSQHRFRCADGSGNPGRCPYLYDQERASLQIPRNVRY